MFWNVIVRDLRRAGISRRLVVYIVMVSTAIALMATAIQLYFDYTSDVLLLEQRLDQVESSFGDSISDSLWNLDTDQVAVVIEGILRLPDIEFIRVLPTDLNQTISTGKRQSEYIKTRHYELRYDQQGESVLVGQMDVEASLTGIFLRLRQKFFVVLITQGVKTFLVALFMFLIFNTLIIRHLDTIAQFARHLRIGGEKPDQLRLERQNRNPDEIDDVVDAINHMQEELHATYLELVSSNVTLDERTRELARHKDNLERLVDERTRELKAAQQSLLDQAHQAGMAEIAAGVLHNVGNSLNSLNISSQLVAERLSSVGMQKLEKTSQLIQDNSRAFVEMVGVDHKFAKLPEYLIALYSRLADEREEIRSELQRMQEHLSMVRSAVKEQQSYALFSSYEEPVDLAELVKDVFKIEALGLKDVHVKAELKLGAVPALQLPKARVSYALLHILKNARDAVSELEDGPRRIEITVERRATSVNCTIKDNGVGIESSVLQHLFDFGFSTKGEGRGFGLHTCALVMKDLGGTIDVRSEGLGKGAEFEFCFPIRNDSSSGATDD